MSFILKMKKNEVIDIFNLFNQMKKQSQSNQPVTLKALKMQFTSKEISSFEYLIKRIHLSPTIEQ
jgi:hypothetical protein